MRFSQIQKPEKNKDTRRAETQNDTAHHKGFVLCQDLHEEHASEWLAVRGVEQAPSFHFNTIPVITLSVSCTVFIANGSARITCMEPLDEKETIIPKHLPVALRRQDTTPGGWFTTIALPGHWTGNEWTWEHYDPLWIVTAYGYDIPVVYSEKGFWRFRKPAFSVLHPLEISIRNDTFYPRLKVARIKAAGESRVALSLLLHYGCEAVLYESTATSLAQIIALFRDKTGWREEFFAETVSILRFSLAEAKKRAAETEPRVKKEDS